MEKIKVAFICVHNSCRSQMAEAFVTTAKEIEAKVQALLFGLLHGALFINEAGATRAILLIAFTGAVAWTMGYLNEKKASGSLFPGWIIHGTTNIISGLISALL